MRVSRVIISDHQSIEHILKILDHRVGPVDNWECSILDIPDTGLADTEFIVVHKLQKIPTFYIYNIDKAGIVYDSNKATWTDIEMTLKCSLPNAQLKLVVL